MIKNIITPGESNINLNSSCSEFQVQGLKKPVQVTEMRDKDLPRSIYSETVPMNV